MNNYLKELKLLLEGKTIINIDNPNDDEGIICRFQLSDGVGFVLCANDLGVWISNKTSNGKLLSLTDVLEKYRIHVQDTLDIFNPKPASISILGNDLYIESPDKKLFTIEITNLSKDELKIIASKVGVQILEEAANFGIMWKMLFQSNNKMCPEELYIREN
jgi:hypothetical protein